MTISVKHDQDAIVSMLEAMDRHLTLLKIARASDPRPTPGEDLPQSHSKPARTGSQRTLSKKTRRAQRYRFAAKVMLVKNERYIKGRLQNISRSGLFVAAHEKIFNEQETVRVIIRPDGVGRSFKVVARVIRFEDRSGQLKGYGLKFIAQPNKLVYHK